MTEQIRQIAQMEMMSEAFRAGTKAMVAYMIDSGRLKPKDGYRIATEWERDNLPYPEGVEVLRWYPGSNTWKKSETSVGWSGVLYCPAFAVPFPPRPTQDWLDRHRAEIVGDWPRVPKRMERYVIHVAYATEMVTDDDRPNQYAYNGLRYIVRDRRPLLKDSPPTSGLGRS
jgi:hypothetical protein